MSSSIGGLPSIEQPWRQYYSREVLDARIPTMSMYDYLVESNAQNLDGPALNYFGARMTFRQLFAEVEKTAKAFRVLGVKEGSIVTVVSLSCVPSVVAMYALNRIGAVSSYVNVLATQEELETYFTEAESQMVITLDIFGKNVLAAAEKTGVKKVLVYSIGDYMPALSRLGFRIKTRKFDRSILKHPLVLLWREFQALAAGQSDMDYKKRGDTLAFFGHTGGTTGFPKNVLLNDHSFNVVAHCYQMCMPHNPGDVFLSGMIPYVIYSTIINIHMPLCLGLETVLIPKFEPADWHRYLKKYRPNHCCLIPAYAQGMLRNENLRGMDLSFLRTFGVGGDGLTLPLEENMNLFFAQHNSSARLQKGYGMTEVCATAVTEYTFARRIGSVGIPLPENNLMIYSNEKECSYGETGEICLQCASEMMGYKDREDEMKMLYRTHADGRVWIHTGDLGYIDEDGFLFLVGRMKRMIMTVMDGKVYKIPPQKVEAVLERCSLVDVCAVVGADHGDNKVLKAYVVPRRGVSGEETVAALKKLCIDNLPENMRPTFYELRESLPHTAAGKVDYLALEKE